MSEWKTHFCWKALLPASWRPKTVDGLPIKSLEVMRRMGPGGMWQYRERTSAETREHVIDEAW